jgi:hypothetical protein
MTLIRYVSDMVESDERMPLTHEKKPRPGTGLLLFACKLFIVPEKTKGLERYVERI